MSVIEWLKAFIYMFLPATAKPETIDNPDGTGQLVAVREGYKIERLPGRPTVKSVYRNVSTLDDFEAEKEDDWVSVVCPSHISAFRDPRDPYTDEVRMHLIATSERAAVRQLLTPAGNTPEQIAEILQCYPVLDMPEEAAEVIIDNLLKVDIEADQSSRVRRDRSGIVVESAEAGKRSVSIRLPERVRFKVNAYIGIPDVTFQVEALVRMDIDGKEIRIRFLPLGLPEAEHAVRQDIAALVSNSYVGDIERDIGPQV